MSSCHDVTADLSRCRDVDLSRCRVVEMSNCRDVELSRCRDVELSSCLRRTLFSLKVNEKVRTDKF